jgi:hypothetical protein
MKKERTNVSLRAMLPHDGEGREICGMGLDIGITSFLATVNVYLWPSQHVNMYIARYTYKFEQGERRRRTQQF